MQILKNKKGYLIALIIVVVILFICFPIQKQAAIYALNKYFIEKNISSEDIYIITILKDYKSAYGGYKMFVKFTKEMDLVYVYRYSFESNKLRLNIIYENERLEKITGGTDIGCFEDENEKIIPMYEPQYYSDLSSMKYTFINYIQDLFSEKLIVNEK